jgi:signal transduction histidine kinase
VEKNLVTKVLLDPKMMRQILDNLISNAIKYSPDKSEILFETKCVDDKILIKVQDHGIGIPKEDQQKLFEPFYRAGNVGSISGTGLGMAIIKNSVELHGGTLQLESEENKGTTIKIELPLIKA